jgi:peptide/nickel transport system substrate-binding protein
VLKARPAAAAAALLMLLACPAGEPRTRPPVPGERPVRGGTLRIELAEDVDVLDPQRAGQPSAWTLIRGMHRGLMAFPASSAPEGARPVPDLAEELPTVSADGLRYEFRLREGVAFGPPASRPLTAADVKAGLERIAAAGSPQAAYFRVITGVATPDERTVVISLALPVNDLLWMLALPAASAVPPGLATVAAPSAIPASGPYRLADTGGYVPERSIHLVRNEAWLPETDHVRAAHVDEIVVAVGASPPEIATRISSGSADLSADSEIDPSASPSPAGRARTVTAPDGCLRYLFMNTRVGPFGSQPVRAAVAAAVDRAPIVASYGSSAIAAAGLLPPTVEGHDAARDPPPRDPNAARAALVAAGQAGFATQLVVGDRGIDAVQARAVRDALAQAGIRVSIRTVPLANLYEDYYEVPAARVPMGIATWCADWPGRGGRSSLAPLLDRRAIATRGNTNYSGFASPALDARFDAAAAERDPAVGAQRWHTLDAELTGLAAVVPLAFLAEVSTVSTRVRGLYAHPFFVRGDITAFWLAGG